MDEAITCALPTYGCVPKTLRRGFYHVLYQNTVVYVCFARKGHPLPRGHFQTKDIQPPGNTKHFLFRYEMDRSNRMIRVWLNAIWGVRMRWHVWVCEGVFLMCLVEWLTDPRSVNGFTTRAEKSWRKFNYTIDLCLSSLHLFDPQFNSVARFTTIHWRATRQQGAYR